MSVALQILDEVNHIEAGLDAMRRDLREIGAIIGRMDNSVWLMQIKVDEMRGAAERIDGSLGRIEARLDTIESNVS